MHACKYRIFFLACSPQVIVFELCSGRGSHGREVANIIDQKMPGARTLHLSLDNDPDHEPTFYMDIGDWTAASTKALMRVFPNCKCIVLVASPPCNVFSR